MENGITSRFYFEKIKCIDLCRLNMLLITLGIGVIYVYYLVDCLIKL